jgi:hypothetical protein
VQSSARQIFRQFISKDFLARRRLQPLGPLRTPHHRVRSRGRHRIFLLPFALASVAAMVLPAAPAAADFEGTRVHYSPCSRIWTEDGQPGKSRLGMHYRATTSNPRVAIINHSRSTLNPYLCTPREPNIGAYRLNLSNQFTFYGSRLDCSFALSLPPGVSWSCSARTDSVSITLSTSCSRAAHCEIAVGPLYFYADPGQSFRNVAYMQGFAHLVNSRGNVYAWSTPRF